MTTQKKGYLFFEGTRCVVSPSERFWQVVRRTLSGELFKGLWLVLREMLRFKTHTIQYPLEKIPLAPRYRAVHELLRLLESGEERCIGCGLCEKVCISQCIAIEAGYGEDRRKRIHSYTINLGRCIFCGFCAEVCPELAIVHGRRYENASEQRAHFALKEDMLTPLDRFLLGEQREFLGFGSLSRNADQKVKATTLAYLSKGEGDV